MVGVVHEYPFNSFKVHSIGLSTPKQSSNAAGTHWLSIISTSVNVAIIKISIIFFIKGHFALVILNDFSTPNLNRIPISILI
jgi:hypothetical protein